METQASGWRVSQRRDVDVYANGILEGRFFNEMLPVVQPTTVKENWKYIPADATGGVLESYQGDELTLKGSLRWIGTNEFEYTFLVAPDRRYLGQRWTFTRRQ